MAMTAASSLAASVRRLSAAEARTVRPELAALLCDAVNHGASVGFLRPMAAELAAQFWEEIIADVEQRARILLVGSDETGIVGTIQLGLCLKPNGRHRAEVQKLLVHTRARRRGLGRILMAAAESEARAAGRTLLFLDTEPDQPAEKMYRALGWSLAGAIPDYACTPDGVLHPTALYYKRLR